jgi:hypothetical protein
MKIKCDIFRDDCFEGDMLQITQKYEREYRSLRKASKGIVI